MRSFLVCILLCLPALVRADDMLVLKPGDSLKIMFEDSSDAAGFEINITALEKPQVAEPQAVVAAPVYEMVWEQVCVNGVCRMQPVRRLVNRTATAVSKMATSTAMAFQPLSTPTFTRSVWYSAPMAVNDGTCGCGCPNCTCGNATMNTRQRLFAPRLLFWRR